MVIYWLAFLWTHLCFNVWYRHFLMRGFLDRVRIQTVRVKLSLNGRVWENRTLLLLLLTWFNYQSDSSSSRGWWQKGKSWGGLWTVIALITLLLPVLIIAIPNSIGNFAVLEELLLLYLLNTLLNKPLEYFIVESCWCFFVIIYWSWATHTYAEVMIPMHYLLITVVVISESQMCRVSEPLWHIYIIMNMMAPNTLSATDVQCSLPPTLHE